jgi:hypothetical protein
MSENQEKAKAAPIQDWRGTRKKKWTEVVVFQGEPRHSPRVSKEGEVVAKFAAEGDAWIYALDLSRHPMTRSAWAVVIR